MRSAATLALVALSLALRSAAGAASDEKTEAFELGQLGLSPEPEEPAAREAARARRAAAAARLRALAVSPDPEVRRAALTGLGKSGGAGEETLFLEASRREDPGERGEAALALFRQRFLERVPSYSTAAAARLGELAAGDPEPEVRWRAAYALSRWPEPRAADALEKAQKDADGRVRLFAYRALGKLARAPELKALSDSFPQARAEAAAAYGAARLSRRLPDGLFRDPSPHVRAAAADAAAASSDTARIPLLEEMADGGGPLPRGRALLALARLGGPAQEGRLARAREDASWWVRARAYEASSLLPGGHGTLRAGLSDPDPRVAAAALEAGAGAGAAWADEELSKVLTDEASPVEPLGTALDEAAARPGSERLAAALLGAVAARGARLVPELRGSARKALSAMAKAQPSRAAELSAAREALPEFSDEPRAFPRPPGAPARYELVLSSGSALLEIDPSLAPNHAAAFADSVRRGLYDGLSWHRAVSGFVVQGGDPRGSGWGDDGWRLADEPSPAPFLRGTIGMPKAGPDTGGCQLFIMLAPAPHLDGRYTAFGRVVSGMEFLDAIQPSDPILRLRAANARLAPP